MTVTETRQDRVLVALNELLPDAFTWTERCDGSWLEAFPCGIAPLFTYGTVLSVCPEQVVRVGVTLDAWDFESFLDACVVWVTSTMTSFVLGESPGDVLALFGAMEAEHARLLSAMAAQHGMTLMQFLGADRPDAV